MMLYGESDYWVARYRSMTEGSAQQQDHSAEGSRRGLVARGTALVTVLFGSIARRSVKKKAGLDGRA
ncbi:MAG: hypothetical protein M3151_15320 [Actinomycetota bacterium]|nr:hypothetical protein [Actinomycetota bacterium]